MALRCASVGACEYAGVTTMNMVVASGSQIFNVLIISGNPSCCRLSTGAIEGEILDEASRMNFSQGRIIFSFEFYRKWIVLSLPCGTPASEQGLRGCKTNWGTG